MPILPFLTRRILIRRPGRMARWRVILFRLLNRHEPGAARYYGIPANRVVEVETRVEL